MLLTVENTLHLLDLSQKLRSFYLAMKIMTTNLNLLTPKDIIKSLPICTWRGQSYHPLVISPSPLFTPIKLNWRGGKYSKRIYRIQMKKSQRQKNLTYRSIPYKK